MRVELEKIGPEETMDESQEKLLKELLQKKLHGTLNADEELILNDLAARKRGGVGLTSSEIPPSGMSNLLGQIDSLNSSFDEMAGKIGMRSGTAQSRQEIADQEKKKKEKK
jgi:hypothetical protein